MTDNNDKDFCRFQASGYGQIPFQGAYVRSLLFLPFHIRMDDRYCRADSVMQIPEDMQVDFRHISDGQESFLFQKKELPLHGA